MIKELKLPKSLARKVQEMGWWIDKPTYQEVMRYALEVRHDYILIAPVKPDQWKVGYVMTNKPNTIDGLLNSYLISDKAKTYKEAMQIGVKDFINSTFEAWKKVASMTDEEREKLLKKTQKSLLKRGIEI